MNFVCNKNLTKPTKYGLVASPNAWENNIWMASALDLLSGSTTYLYSQKKTKEKEIFRLLIFHDENLEKGKKSVDWNDEIMAKITSNHPFLAVRAHNMKENVSNQTSNIDELWWWNDFHIKYI